ncbi:putative methionine/alanine importer small subunit [Ornithinimicrobium sp. CNJ-824]|uniref:methionine/alanine import family NSS transporter small subunit n=1 Tax=Ornithinimicrobium sp. CNJ-824 TaxID=1904966 RepID=UPI0009621767|nr:methionine/alanine import family NSS transporter small subunit [Ornithinimicrobium sp. CNJ-824]OLT21736.1 putative methionine/alanine importer small subunit [Ornithinimicrobium sp. CNJ-824]
MNTGAIVMMLVAMVVVWGGLVASILYLRSRPEVTDGLHEDPDLVRDDERREHEPHPFRDT